MKTEQGNRDPSQIDQLFVFNKTAGRLRFVLILLLFFIIWSIVAQSKLSLPIFLDIFNKLFPESTDFTSGVIQEILYSYFSPSTIFITLIPFIIFLSTRTIIGNFIHTLFPEIELKHILRYLNNCAFSFSPRHYDLSGQTGNKRQKGMHELANLGGPAKITLSAGSIPIISNIKGYYFSSFFPNDDIKKYDLSLTHGELINSIVTKEDSKIFFDQISLNHRPENFIQINNIGLNIDLDDSDKNTHRSRYRNISISDALAYYNLNMNSHEIINSFLIDEIKTFFKFDPFIIDWFGVSLSNKNRDHIDLSNSLINKFHRNYNQDISIRNLPSEQITRKHKHTLYPYIRKNEIESEKLEEIQGKSEKIEQKLLSYLNKQLSSFFSISNSLITSIEIGEIKVNGKNQIFK